MGLIKNKKFDLDFKTIFGRLTSAARLMLLGSYARALSIVNHDNKRDRSSKWA
jgi:hypothetical protein